MTAKPKENHIITEQCFGDFTGVTIEVPLVTGQKWTVKKSNGYYWLWRKGIKLRLTETALCRLFDLEV